MSRSTSSTNDAVLRALQQRQRQAAIDGYLANPNHCQKCGVAIPVRPNQKITAVREKKYCSRTCAAVANNTKYPKRKPEGVCDHCGKEARASLKYCSRECVVAAYRARRGPQDSKKINYVVQWRRSTKAKAVEIMGGKCMVCGYSRSIRSLHFHHIDRAQKDFAISRGIKSWEKVAAELKKCVLVCANCHGEIHDGLIDLSLFLGSKEEMHSAVNRAISEVRVLPEEPFTLRVAQ